MFFSPLKGTFQDPAVGILLAAAWPVPSRENVEFLFLCSSRAPWLTEIRQQVHHQRWLPLAATAEAAEDLDGETRTDKSLVDQDIVAEGKSLVNNKQEFLATFANTRNTLVLICCLALWRMSPQLRTLGHQLIY